MNYPLEILPNENYKLIDCDLSDHYLLRITDTSDLSKIIDIETGYVSIKYICSPSERIVDFSTNLLGIYNAEHIYLDFTVEGKNRYMHYCAPSEKVDPPQLERDYRKNDDRYFWCVAINRLNRVIFKYPYGQGTLEATCIVKHTPMFWNFWHFSLRWETNLGLLTKIGTNAEGKTAQKIGHSVRSALSLFTKVGAPEKYSVLAKDCYCSII